MGCLNNCSGNGICIGNETIGVCVCNDGYTGKSDLLSFDGYDCQTPVIGEKIVWSLALLGSLVLFVKHIKAIKTQLERFGQAKARAAKKGLNLKLYQFAPLQVLGVGVFISCPCIFTVALLKVIEFEHRELGTDIMISVFFIMIVISGFVANVFAELLQFDAVVQGSPINPDDRKKLRKSLSTRYWVSIFWYASVTTFAILAGCVLGHTDPTTSPNRFTLIIRNISLVIFMLTLAKINKVVADQARNLVATMSQGQVSESTVKAQRVLDILTQNSKTKTKTGTIAAVLYITFCLPPLWAYQTFCIGTLVCQVCLSKSHYVHAYLVKSSKTSKVSNMSGVSSAGSSQLSVA